MKKLYIILFYVILILLSWGFAWFFTRHRSNSFTWQLGAVVVAGLVCIALWFTVGKKNAY